MHYDYLIQLFDQNMVKSEFQELFVKKKENLLCQKWIFSIWKVC